MLIRSNELTPGMIRVGFATAALLVLAAIVLIVGAGCSSEAVEDEGLAEQDREALASLGYVATEVARAGGLPSEKKVLVIGIDGMDYMITTRLLDEGKLPTFRKLAEDGGFSPLLSSIPPQSPVAWSNFITGQDAG